MATFHRKKSRLSGKLRVINKRSCTVCHWTRKHWVGTSEACRSPPVNVAELGMPDMLSGIVSSGNPPSKLRTNVQEINNTNSPSCTCHNGKMTEVGCLRSPGRLRAHVHGVIF